MPCFRPNFTCHRQKVRAGGKSSALGVCSIARDSRRLRDVRIDRASIPAAPANLIRRTWHHSSRVVARSWSGRRRGRRRQSQAGAAATTGANRTRRNQHSSTGETIVRRRVVAAAAGTRTYPSVDYSGRAVGFGSRRDARHCRRAECKNRDRLTRCRRTRRSGHRARQRRDDANRDSSGSSAIHTGGRARAGARRDSRRMRGATERHVHQLPREALDHSGVWVGRGSHQGCRAVALHTR